MSDLAFFLGRLLRRPHEIAAVAPSSEALARAMAAEIPEAARDGTVVELGPGTGKITTALLEIGIAPEKLHAFELSEDFVDHLRTNFPDINVHHAPAQKMGELKLDQVGAVVSGLPLLSMPLPIQEQIMGAAFATMRPGGVFIQFTYGPKPSVARPIREAMGLRWTRSEVIWGNLPPARVYTFTQQPQ